VAAETLTDLTDGTILRASVREPSALSGNETPEAVLPNIKSAEKRMRTSRIRAARNRMVRTRIRTAIKKVRSADTAEAADQALRTATALIDRAATRRVIHPNKAARTKSQLAGIVKTKSATA
jgi:small subunit ribosomal protein S20